MTTIAADFARKIMVADSLYSDEDGLKVAAATKVYFVTYKGYPALLGAAGWQYDIEMVVAWLEGKSKRKPKLKNKNDFLLLYEKGLLLADNNLIWEKSVTNHGVVGTGAMAVEAAVWLKAPIELAVEAATNVDLYSGPPITIYNLNDPPRTTDNQTLSKL